MSKQLQKLIVSLEAESSKLTAQLDKSNKKLKKWENKAGKSIDGVKKAFIGLATVATVAIFARMAKGSIEFADSIGKVSDAVGLATDTYQGFVHAASLAGVEQSQLNSNLTAFVKRVGEAREGVGPLISFLRKYDETLLKNIQSSKNQEHAFNLMADAIQKATTATDKAALANAAFSRAGVSMTLMMRNGAAGLKEMRKEAHKLGIILDEQTIRKAEEANDKLDIMARVIKTNVIKQLVRLSPQIIKVGNAFAEAIPKVTKFFERIFDKTSVAALEQNLESLERKAIKTQNKIATIKSEGFFKGSLTGTFFSAVFGDTVEELNAKLDGIKARTVKTIDDIKAKKAELALQADALTLGLDADGGGEAASKELTAAQEKIATKFAMLDESLLAETDRLILAHDRRKEIINDFFEFTVDDTGRKDAILESLEEKHQKKLIKIKKKGLTDLEKFNAMSWKGQTKTIAGELVNMTAGVAQSNKTMFKINKISAIANAVMNTYQGVTNALAAYPPPVSFIMAGVQLAAGLAQVSAIKATTFGGGGGAPSLAGAGGGASTTVNTTSAISPDITDGEITQEPQKVVNISISGNPTGEQVRELIEIINEEQGNGAVLNATVAA